jgi:hypothetical protein
VPPAGLEVLALEDQAGSQGALQVRHGHADVAAAAQLASQGFVGVELMTMIVIGCLFLGLEAGTRKKTP